VDKDVAQFNNLYWLLLVFEMELNYIR